MRHASERTDGKDLSALRSQRRQRQDIRRKRVWLRLVFAMVMSVSSIWSPRPSRGALAFGDAAQAAAQISAAPRLLREHLQFDRDRPLCQPDRSFKETKRQRIIFSVRCLRLAKDAAMRSLTKPGKRRHLRPCRLAPPFSTVFAAPGSGPGWRWPMRCASWPWRSHQPRPWPRSAVRTASCSAPASRFLTMASRFRSAISPIARAARSIRSSPVRQSRPCPRRGGLPRVWHRLRPWPRACRIVSQPGSRSRARRLPAETSACPSASNSSLSALS